MRAIACFFLVVTFMAAGCSPQYNWRQVDVGDGVATAFFPEKTHTQSRELQFSGHDITFNLTSAVVGDASFTVAHALFPQALRANAGERESMGRAVTESLYRNLGATPPEPLPPFGQPFTVEGDSPQGRIRLQAVVWVTPSALVEGLVTAPPEGFPQDAAAEFMGGLKAGD